MKTSARPSARINTSAHAGSGIAERVYRSCLRAWLRHRLKTYKRSLYTIAAQRENDFHAERLLHREISTTRSRLQSL